MKKKKRTKSRPVREVAPPNKCKTCVFSPKKKRKDSGNIFRSERKMLMVSDIVPLIQRITKDVDKQFWAENPSIDRLIWGLSEEILALQKVVSKQHQKLSKLSKV